MRTPAQKSSSEFFINDLIFILLFHFFGLKLAVLFIILLSFFCLFLLIFLACILVFQSFSVVFFKSLDVFKVAFYHPPLINPSFPI